MQAQVVHFKIKWGLNRCFLLIDYMLHNIFLKYHIYSGLFCPYGTNSIDLSLVKTRIVLFTSSLVIAHLSPIQYGDHS